jgi:hypothetical protein
MVVNRRGCRGAYNDFSQELTLRGGMDTGSHVGGMMCDEQSKALLDP